MSFFLNWKKKILLFHVVFRMSFTQLIKKMKHEKKKKRHGLYPQRTHRDIQIQITNQCSKSNDRNIPKNLGSRRLLTQLG